VRGEIPLFFFSSFSPPLPLRCLAYAQVPASGDLEGEDEVYSFPFLLLLLSFSVA